MNENTRNFASNRARLEHVFAQTAKGDGRPFLDAFAEDASWTVTGTTGWSPLRRILAPPLKTHARRFIDAGDIVVVEARGENVTRDGKPYENNYCYIFEFCDGQVAALTEYADTELFRSALGEPG
jgi:uncharacterized protein